MRKYLSDGVQWSEVFAAIYLDPARIFPLVGNGPVKKLHGLPDESFIELVLGDWRVVDLGQLKWQAPNELVAALRNPFAMGDNIKTEPSQIEIQNAKRKNSDGSLHQLPLPLL